MGKKGKYWDEGKKRRIKEERGGRAWFCFFPPNFFYFYFCNNDIKIQEYRNNTLKGEEKKLNGNQYLHHATYTSNLQ